MLDYLSGAPVELTWDHHKIHDGRGFTHTGKTSLGAGATYYHLLDNPANNYPHLRDIEIQADGAPMDVWLLEGVTVSVNGSKNDGFNNNRNKTATPLMAVYDGATITADGTILEYFMIAGTKQSGGFGGKNSDAEWILKPSTKYAVKVTNNAQATVNFGVYIYWYE